MKIVTLCLLAAALIGSSTGVLPPPDKSYKILILLPYWGRSHKNFIMPLAEGLADRGHSVVILTMLADQPTHPNITEINFVHDTKSGTFNMFDHTNDYTGGYSLSKTFLPKMAREIYKLPAVKKLYERRKDFDLIVMNNLFSEMVYPFLHEMPFITVSTAGMIPHYSAILGNPINPSYAPNAFTSYPLPMSLWHRLKNTALHAFLPFYWNHWAVMPLVQEEISGQFPDVPPLLELERNQSLTLLNSHFSINTPVPLLPSQVEVGAMHCRPAKPLPQDLDQWLNEAGSAGVVYFSLGSNARGESMPLKYRLVFLEAFRRLPQRVLWKYEGELRGAPNNVRISSWVPQQDVLAHHNVKVFISHGGLLSLQESIFHGTPLLVLPIFSDQPRNGWVAVDSGFGRVLLWEELTADRIINDLADLITNPKYKVNAVRVSESLKDQLTTPQERAVFWTEYVIRHRGAPQLRCPAAQLSWVEFLMLDVIGFLLLSLLALLLLLRRILRALLAVVFSRRPKIKTA